MIIFNTKTRKEEEFKALNLREIKIYSCWPTVYNYAHIWNLRTYVCEDIFIKTLRYLWYNLKTLMNITDIDDKTIKESRNQNLDLGTFTKKYIDLFLEDLEKLNVDKADTIVPVTQLIPEIIRLINTMLKRWNAYLSNDNSIYFRVSSFKNYWKFANLDLSSFKDWLKTDKDEYNKEEIADFVLWKAYKDIDLENYWDCEFQIPSNEDKSIKKTIIRWRPGWHIECSACNIKYFWAQIDIHIWGEDLIFPHHQNEIAQTESCTRKEFSRYWIHIWHLMVDWKKMAKSSWNFYTVKYLEEKYLNLENNSDLKEERSVLYRALRLLFIMWKYRDTIDFSFDKLDANINTIKRIDKSIKKIYLLLNSTNKGKITKEFSDELQNFIYLYVSNLEDNFNTPEVLAVFFNFIKFINTWIDSFNKSQLEASIHVIENFNQVLSIIDFNVIKNNSKIELEILELLEKRNKAKELKDFLLSDKIRDEIYKNWYKILDTKSWAILEKL